MTHATEAISRAPRLAVMGLIRGYQQVISPITGPTCKYYPSCSHYGLEAVREHGALVGGALATWRVLRCNPWSNGGVDDVPARGERLFRLHRNNDDFSQAAAGAATDRERELALTQGLPWTSY